MGVHGHEEELISYGNSGWRDDRASRATSDDGLSGDGPYRNHRDALIAERRALTRSLRETAARLTAVEASLRDRSRPPVTEAPRPWLPRRLLTGGLMLVAATAPVLAVGWAVDAASSEMLRGTRMMVVPAAPPKTAAPVGVPKPAPPPEPARSTLDYDDVAQWMDDPISEPPTDASRHIRQLDPRLWEIDESFVGEVMDTQTTLLRPNRIIPHEENGRVVGIRIFGIRRGSLTWELGFRSGDLVRSVNGLDISSPDAALSAYTQMRAQDVLVFELTRRGQRHFHVIRVARGR